MPGLDLTLAMFTQLTDALVALGFEHLDIDRFEHAARHDRGLFAQLFGEHMETLERLCCARDHVPVFAHLAGDMMSRAVINCPDLHAVLDRSCQFGAMIVGKERSSTLVPQGDLVRFEIVARYATRDDAAMLSDVIGMQYHLALLTWLSGRALMPVGVALAYSRSRRPNPLLGLFRSDIQFECSRSALLFDKADLARPVIRSLGELEGIIDCFPYNFIIDAIGDTGLSSQVEPLMKDALREGRGVPSEKMIANSLGISGATLRRQLRRQGTSYSQLRAVSLRQEAERLMQDRDIAIASIAQRLGFSDDRAFRRAFRSWTGSSPSASPARVVRSRRRAPDHRS